MEFYPLGRHALLAALCRMGLKAGDIVVFPAYYCESTLGILRDYGFRLAYVDADEKLRPDVQGLESRCNEGAVGAMVVVHYFGFKSVLSPKLVGLCERHGVRIIEDYSHSFLSFDPAEPNTGPASAFVYSMRKTLPVSDGGALLMPGMGEGNGNPEQTTGVLGSLTFLARGYAETLCIRLGWPNLYSSGMDGLKRSVGRVFGGFSRAAAEPLPPVAPSPLLRRLLRDHELLRDIVERRLHNYRQLRTGLCGIEGLAFLYPDGADGVPFVLPLLSSEKGLLGYLREHGIGAFPWPGEDVPLEVRERPEVFPNTIDINGRVVCMPVHQDISDVHIAYMIDTVGSFFAQVGQRP